MIGQALVWLLLVLAGLIAAQVAIFKWACRTFWRARREVDRELD
jgi:hypothetical protein